MPLPEPPKPPIQSRDRRDPLATVRDGIGGGYYTQAEWDQLTAWHDECREVRRFNQREEWEHTQHGKVCVEMYQKFQEYKKLLEENPQARVGMTWSEDFPEHRLFLEALYEAEERESKREEQDQRNLEKARQAPRCQHMFLNGDRCQAPRKRGKKLCRMHERIEETKPVKIDLGSLEDPDSIQLAIQKLLKAIVDGVVDPKSIGQVTNLLQVAAWNVSRTTFGVETMGEAADIG